MENKPVTISDICANILAKDKSKTYVTIEEIAKVISSNIKEHFKNEVKGGMEWKQSKGKKK